MVYAVVPRASNPEKRVRFPLLAPLDEERKQRYSINEFGLIVITGARCVCTAEVRVQFPVGPPSRPARRAEGAAFVVEAIASQWWGKRQSSITLRDRLVD